MPAQTVICQAFRLPDGSQCEVGDCPTAGPFCSIVSRRVAGVVVWGQVFSAHDEPTHALQVAAVVESMTAHPDAFARHWDPVTGVAR